MQQHHTGTQRRFINVAPGLCESEPGAEKRGMIMPIRIQRKRTKGWRMPENTINCTRPCKYGNPFKIGDPSPQNYKVIIDRQHSIELFELMIESMKEAGTFDTYIQPLKGKNLACFCSLSTPCHVDVLLIEAN
jgi:hypothetical protein